jgi:hypothetical protein
MLSDEQILEIATHHLEMGDLLRSTRTGLVYGEVQVVPFARALLAASSPECGSGPIYQMKVEGIFGRWDDISKEQYDRSLAHGDPTRVRIAHTTSTSPPESGLVQNESADFEAWVEPRNFTSSSRDAARLGWMARARIAKSATPPAQPAQDEPRECCSADCGWKGDVSETVQMKHGYPNKLCPKCHEVTELASHQANDERAPLEAWIDDECERTGQEIRRNGWALDWVRRAWQAARTSASTAQTAAARDVLAERERQVTQEGWTPEHDDEHDEGQLSMAACGYASRASDAAQDIRHGLTGGLTYDDVYIGAPGPEFWPHGWEFKAATPRRMLVKAGALILAEIERLDRDVAKGAK